MSSTFFIINIQYYVVIFTKQSNSKFVLYVFKRFDTNG
jgi:hypothetical protein